MIKIDIDCHKNRHDDKVILHCLSIYAKLEDKINLINSEQLIIKNYTDGIELHHIFFSDHYVSKLKDEFNNYKQQHQEENEKFIKLEQENERMQKLISYYENLNLLLE